MSLLRIARSPSCAFVTAVAVLLAIMGCGGSQGSTGPEQPSDGGGSGGSAGSAGSSAGSVSGVASGSMSGSTSGTTAGSVSGTTSGSASGTTSGSASGTTSGSASGTTAGSMSGSGPEPGDAGGCSACGAGQLCVYPSCGGGTAQPCSALNDAGGCPVGWSYSNQCLNGITASPGCMPPPCVPPPPFCVDLPATCNGTANCSCLPNNVCEVMLPGNAYTGGQCLFVHAAVVSCGSA